MQISAIREFVHLAQSRSFTRAAADLYIAQSTLSRHINAIEDELGVRLIDRDHSHFELTPAGETTLAEFHKILTCYGRLLDTLTEQDKMLEGSIELGVLYYDRNCYVSQIRKAFHNKYPAIRLVLHSHQPHELEASLFSGEYDAIVAYGAKRCGRSDIDYLPFLEIPYCLIYHKNHRFAHMPKVTASQLCKERLLVPSKPLAITSAGIELPQILAESGIRFSDTIEISNYDEVPWVMEETGAVYLSPMANPSAYGPDTRYRDFLPEKYSCDVSLVWLRSNDNPVLPCLSQAIRSCYP